MKGIVLRPVAASVSDKYELIEPIGGTSLSITYEARERANGALRVIKVPRLIALESHEPLGRFKAVAEKIQTVRHPNILPIEEVGSEGSQVWVVSRFEEAPTVRELLLEGFPLSDALDIVSQAALALQAAHDAGVVHGDIRPGNLFWREDKTAVVSDFGAGLLADGVHNLMRESLMTPLPGYLSPELDHHPAPTQASDVYALGALLYEIVTGQSPFSGSSAAAVFAKQRVHGLLVPKRVNDDLPDAVEKAVLKALEYKPEDRYSSAAAMATALTEVRSALSASDANLRVPPAHQREEHTAIAALRRSPVVDADSALDVERHPIEEGFVECAVCSTVSSTAIDFCPNCWHDLSGLPIMDEHEAQKAQARFRRRLRIRKMLRYGIPIAAVFILTFWLVTRDTPPGDGLPAPTTAISAISAEGEWVSFAYDTEGTGFVSTSAPVPAGNVRWSQDVGAPVVSGAIVAGERLFVANDDRQIFAFNQRTGSRIWQTELPGPVIATPSYAGGLVYIGLMSAELVAVHAETGEIAWQIKLGESILRSTTVADGVAYTTGINGTLYATDAATGELRWQRTLGSGIRSAPAFTDGLLVVGTVDRHLFVLDADTGAIRLDYLTPRAVEVSSAIDPIRGVVYTGTNFSTLHAVNIRAENKLFEKTLNQWWAQFFIWGLLPSAPIQSGTEWSTALDAHVNADPAVAHGKVFVGTKVGTFFALDARDGKKLWSFSAVEGIRTPATVVNNTVFFGSNDDNVYALDTETGEELWRFQTGGDVTSASSFADGLLFVTSADGFVYALD